MVRKLITLVLMMAVLSGCGGKSKETLLSEATKKLKEGNPGAAIVMLRNALEKDPNYVEARYQLAKAYLEATKYEQAEKELQKVLTANPTKTEIHLDLAKVANGLSKPELAGKELQEYLKNHPETAETLEVQAVTAALSERMVEAEQYLLKALKAEPTRVSAKLHLAGVYAGLKKTDQARELLTAIIKEKPSESRAYQILAQIEYAQGDKEKAIAVYQQQADAEKKNPYPLLRIGTIRLDMGQFDKANAVADDLIKRFDKRGEGYRLKGLIYYQQKNYPEAIASLQKAIQLQPSLDSYYFLGMSMYMRKEYENALSQFRLILDRNPDIGQVRLMVAMILMSQKRLDDAIAETQKVIKGNEQMALAHNILGSAYMAKGMFAEGMKELNRATELDPKLIDAHLKKGVYHLSTGNIKETESDLKTAVQVAPDILNTRMILAAYYLRQQNFDRAVAVMKEGLTKSKADAPLYNNLASIMFMQKKNAEGVGFLQKAKEVDPAYLNTYFNMATYYLANKEQDKALAEYRMVLQKDPVNIRALLTMGGYYESVGNDAEALNYLVKAAESKNISAYVALSSFYMKKKQGDKALAMIDAAIKELPKNPDLLEIKGRILLAEKKTKDAVGIFEQIEAIKPERGITLKIQTYSINKEYPKAAEEARKLITLQPKSGKGYMVLAEIYEIQGDRGRAIEELKQGIRADSTNTSLLIQLGYTYARKKDFGLAKSTFEEVLRKDPKASAPALFGLGSLNEEQGKRDEAAKLYREALKRNPSYAPALNNLAVLALEGVGGKPAEGLRLAELAIKGDPSNPNLLDTYGYALFRNGRIPEAKKVLERVASVLPDNPSVNYHLALVYREAGDRAQALARINKALEKGRFLEEPQARKLLAELTSGKTR